MSDKTILGSSVPFMYSCDILLEKMKSSTNPKDLSLVVSIAVNAAFACELLFKSILENKVKGHNLDNLFKMLEPTIQTEIRILVEKDMIKKNINYSDSDFSSNLYKNRNTFLQWRYFYEGNTEKLNFQFLLSLMNSLFNVAKKNLKN